MRAEPEHEFTEFADSVWRDLRRTAYLMCGDWQRAEDATQEALVKLYVAWSRLDRGRGLRAYAHRTVASAVLDQSKRPWRRERSHAEIPEQSTNEDGSEQRARRDVVMGALSALGPGQRACVVLRYDADLSVAETARLLGLSEGTVKSQTARGLATLRAALAAGDTDERGVR